MASVTLFLLPAGGLPWVSGYKVFSRGRVRVQLGLYWGQNLKLWTLLWLQALLGFFSPFCEVFFSEKLDI